MGDDPVARPHRGRFGQEARKLAGVETSLALMAAGEKGLTLAREAAGQAGNELKRVPGQHPLASVHRTAAGLYRIDGYRGWPPME